MAFRRLPNYLRRHRMHLSLSQEEIAYLLGARDGGKVSRYETFRREPEFRTALALQIIFQRSGDELFGKIYDEIGREIAARARLLIHRIGRRKQSKRNLRKKDALKAIASLYPDK